MQDLIRTLAERLDIGEDDARQVAATLVAFVRDHADDADVQALFSQSPAARRLAEQAAADDTANETAGSGLAGMLSNLLGGTAGGALAVLGRLQAMGLDSGQIGEAGRLVFEHLSREADADTVQRILRRLADRVPGLDRFL